MKFRVFLVVASCLVSMITGLVLARGRAPAQGKTDSRQLHIGFSMDTLKEERFQRDRDIFAGRAKELGAQVIVQSANSDDARQISDVQSLISQKVNVLVIMPHNGAAMAKAVELAHE